MLKMNFFNLYSKKEALNQIENQLIQRRQKLIELKEIYHSIVNEDYKYSENDTGNILVLDYAIEREKNYILWLEKIISDYEKFII